MTQSIARPNNPPPPIAAATNRMTLTSVKRGRIDKSKRILLYGVEKIGKSTFAAGAPNAIFIGAEDGTAQIDVARFPQPESWEDVMGALRNLEKDEHDYQTVVIDTIDWLEPLLWAFICKRDGKRDVESYGFAKGYIAALDEWRLLLHRLDALRATRSMHVILLGHSWIKPFKSPTSEDYDRFELKIHAKAAGLVKEWADAVLFATYEDFAVEKSGRVRGVSSGARLIHTQRRAAWDAGNRFGLPETIPLSWDEFDAACKTGAPADVATLRADIAALLEQVDAASRTKAEAWLSQQPRDGRALAEMADRLRGKVQISSETNNNETTKEVSQ